MTKYGAEKITVDGIKFDSKVEAEYYEHLLKKKELGIVTDIELQPVLNIHPAFTYRGKKRQKMDYRLDFRVVYSDGYEVYIDIKGMATPDGNMKRKLVEYFHRDKNIIWISKSVKYGDRFGFIEYDELKKIRAANKRAKTKMKRGNK
ncbi:DUF1064 domain-containing protein [Salinicoccus roseus]|uniref:DUF1064 domain-containing protein n=1 Tax=Salinicoccus roseus TaxID=45670 RepID=UPI0023002C65|nr:DUF1064 domain-containing protein [Salinicoccus roseus]